MSRDQDRDEENVDKRTTSCGLGEYSPRWLQTFASKKTYVLVYGLLGMNQTAIASYFIGTISTIEKKFKLPSSVSGMIASSWDFGALCTVLLIAYFGSTGHKTRWVSFCSIFAAISCFLRYVPHLLYGSSQDYNCAPMNSSYHLCNENIKENKICSLNSDGFMTSLILTGAHIALGVGTSTYNTLGAAYLDDNTLKAKVPFLISLVTCLRHLGPTLGYLLASFALKINENLNSDNEFKTTDQKWIGAWYLGWIPLGVVHLVLALLMAFFPMTLPREAQRRKTLIRPFIELNSQKNCSINDMKNTLSRLFQNRVLMYNCLSLTSYMFGVAGYAIFMPKYIETQFKQSPSRASLITGTIGLVCTLFGVMLSGSVITRYKPPPRYLAAWSIFTKVVELTVHIVFAFLGCNMNNVNNTLASSKTLNLISECNAVCNCSALSTYSPVCSMDRTVTFFSPCHAGCQRNYLLNGSMVFDDCLCIPNNGFVTEGSCPTDCESHFIIFIVLLCLIRLVSSTGRAGNTVIQYRSVDPGDKSISIALGEVMICGLAFVPAPIIYGLLLDSSCLTWGESCGSNGNCLFYDGKKLRYYLNFTAAAFFILAALFDFAVFRNVRKLCLYDEENCQLSTKEPHEIICKNNEEELENCVKSNSR